MLEIRPQDVRDVHHLMDIDLKCFDTPWPVAIWRRVSQDCLLWVACWKNTPIGFVIFKPHYDGDIEIVKLAVKPAYRSAHISYQLLRLVEKYAAEAQSPVIRMVIPEVRLCPGETDDLSAWATKCGFKARRYVAPSIVEFYKPTP
jgi:ribosomal protein S18 acetylase RimI-like enzyme